MLLAYSRHVAGGGHCSSKLLNMEELYVRSDTGVKQLAWCIIVDLYCLDHDGSLFDAAIIALIAALKNSMYY
jgi:exosome complex RNA-binding protein Rrp42 (RNase PH superfamily)